MGNGTMRKRECKKKEKLARPLRRTSLSASVVSIPPLAAAPGAYESEGKKERKVEGGIYVHLKRSLTRNE